MDQYGVTTEEKGSGANRPGAYTKGEPVGGKQSSGTTKHARSGGYNMAGGNIENMNGMPNVHTGGGKGNLAGVSTRGKSLKKGKVNTN